MSTINTNIPSLVAARILNRNNQDLSKTLERLSTGLKINRGSDDPAGLIASETLRAEQAALKSAVGNAERANNVIGVAEGALQEVSSLLIEMENLVDQSASEAGLSPAEVAANQLQIDSILDTINRIATTTTFAGKKLLDGSLSYTLSGVSTASVADAFVNAARIPNGGYRSVQIDVTGSAQKGTLTYTGQSGTNDIASAVTITVAGIKGTDTFSFAASTKVSAIAQAINQSSDLTGVEATASSNTLTITSTRYGSDQFVSVEALSGTFTVTGGDSATRDAGVDATVLINGTTANVTGLDVALRTSTLDLDLTLTEAFATDPSLSAVTFAVTGGGARFQMAPDLSLAGLTALGMRSVNTTKLGTNTVGFLSSLGSGQTNQLTSKNFQTAQEIVRTAATQVAELRGRLGAVQKNVIQSSINSLKVAYENVTAAESAIRDADFAEETSNLTRSQILAQTSTATLQLANAAPQNVLSLL